VRTGKVGGRVEEEQAHRAGLFVSRISQTKSLIIATFLEGKIISPQESTRFFSISNMQSNGIILKEITDDPKVRLWCIKKMKDLRKEKREA
jgi:hypothetical protein